MKSAMMRTTLSVMLLLVPIHHLLAATNQTLPKDTPVKDYFILKGGCTEAIITKIKQAKKEILFQNYSFTSAPITKALLDSHKKGIKVVLVLDVNQKYSSVAFLTSAGIPTFTVNARERFASNVMVIDRELLISGNFNFTTDADDKNANNVGFTRHREMAKGKIMYWEQCKVRAGLRDDNPSLLDKPKEKKRITTPILSKRSLQRYS